MLSGARTQRRPALSQQLHDRMKSLFPGQTPNLIAASVLLSNTYSSVGEVQQAQEVRIDRLKQFGNRMRMGVSWTEVNGDLVVSVPRALVFQHERSDIFAFSEVQRP